MEEQDAASAPLHEVFDALRLIIKARKKKKDKAVDMLT